MNREQVFAEIQDLAELSLMIAKRCVELQALLAQSDEPEEEPPFGEIDGYEISRTFDELASQMFH